VSKCRVCEEAAGEGSVYCPRHHRAYKNLEAAYPQWRYALGLDWQGYLEAVTRAPGTGAWVRDVAADILGDV